MLVVRVAVDVCSKTMKTSEIVDMFVVTVVVDVCSETINRSEGKHREILHLPVSVVKDVLDDVVVASPILNTMGLIRNFTFSASAGIFHV